LLLLLLLCAAVSEFVASNIKDDELEGYCAMVEDEAMMGTMKVLLDPKNDAQVAAMAEQGLGVGSCSVFRVFGAGEHVCSV
jgi:hypothetical protein